MQLPDHVSVEPHSLDIPTIHELDVYKILSNLDTSKATGPDEIGNRILKEIASPISRPLCRLFNKCLSAGTFPDIWKTARVTVLHKKGDMDKCENYRPISILCCISKVFEKLIYNHVYCYLDRYNILTDRQSGFRPNDSTVKQLVSICHRIYSCLDDGDEILSIFLDFRKAFDKVWHRGLIWKLEQIGITGRLLLIFESYITNRQQYVSIDGSNSGSRTIHSGVPQGSVLGPLLFLIFINDICNDVSSAIQLYADDTSLFTTVKKGNMISAANQINQDLDHRRHLLLLLFGNTKQLVEHDIVSVHFWLLLALLPQPHP